MACKLIAPNGRMGFYLCLRQKRSFFACVSVCVCAGYAGLKSQPNWFLVPRLSCKNEARLILRPPVLRYPFFERWAPQFNGYTTINRLVRVYDRSFCRFGSFRSVPFRGQIKLAEMGKRAVLKRECQCFGQSFGQRLQNLHEKECLRRREREREIELKLD